MNRPQKYRKLPVVIETIQFDGTAKNAKEIALWIGDGTLFGYSIDYGYERFTIKTIEGIMTAQLNDWIIKGVKGEFYPCKPDIFAATYEPAESEEE